MSEAIGIQWTDFEGDVLHVQRRIYEGEAGALKTAKSERLLPLPALLLARLHKLPRRGVWVFSSREGTPLNPGNTRIRVLKPAAKKLVFSIAGWHDLRHTLATRMLRSGESAKLVAGILGHGTVKTTLEIYDHPDVESFRQPLDYMAKLLSS